MATLFAGGICAPGGPVAAPMASGGESMSFALHTAVFAPGSEIPTRYTCSGPDLSPPLSWTDAPTGTQALALIVDDPDAPGGTFTHWLVYGLLPGQKELREDVPKDDRTPDGALQGRNDFGKAGYGGPCPPPGKPHRYVFTLFALDRRLQLKPGVGRAELENAMRGHILGEAKLMGNFHR
jgi:hypothetical protein